MDIDEPSSLAHFVERWLLRWRDSVAPGDEVDQGFARSVGEFRASLPRRTESASGIFCGSLWFLCWFARTAFSDVGPPMLHVFDGGPTMFIPTSWHELSLRAVERMASNPGHDVLAAYSPLVAAQILYRTGFRIPWLPPISLYTWCGDGLLSHDAMKPLYYNPQRQEFLITRSFFWRQVGGKILRSLMRKFERQAEGIPVVRFHWMEHMQPFAEHFRRNLVQDFLPFKELPKFLGAVMMLPDFVQVMFHDLYSLHVPILLPTPDWLGRVIMHVAFCYDNILHAQGGTVLMTDVAQKERSLFFEAPWLEYGSFAGTWKVAPADRLRMRWLMSYANHAAYPHLIEFKSVPDLFQLTAGGADLHLLSIRMATFHRRLSIRAIEFYKHILHNLRRPEHSSNEGNRVTTQVTASELDRYRVEVCVALQNRIRH